ncbi:hypothetical protein PT279_00050 [Bifidobacterium sp. ESL0784]|uniref:hypothetical protein n=1 Tax=Bifidobacterium sp. ESL0784 TaxID=2983231 RepID=UPI0023F86B4D|nr:hypothetical protein [Bifidobacterium sp. ESL0784]MDF7639998.1 hypothetical protein [Bifidobacterium sp. ESL0784]
MKLGKQIRSAVGIVLSAATLLALGITGVGTANADDTIADLATSGDDGQITIKKGDGGYYDEGGGSVFYALRIGDYGKAATRTTSAPETTIEGVEIKGTADKVTPYSGDPVAAGTPTEINPIMATEVQAVLDEANPGTSHQLTDDEKANPIGYVARHWLGYEKTDTSEGATNDDEQSKDMHKTGLLRKFATRLQTNATLKSAFVNDAPELQAADWDATSKTYKLTGIKEGIYLIEDVTGGTNAMSIPMIVGSTVGPNHLQKFTGGNTNLGTVEVKAEIPSVDKELMKVDGTEVHGVASGIHIGSILTYKVTAKVPNYTGFSSYMYKLIDKPSNMELVDHTTTGGSDMTVTVGGDSKTLTTVDDVDGAAPPNPTTGILYQAPVTTGPNQTPNFTLKFLDIMTYTINDDIVVNYTMKVNGTGAANNIDEQWSNNPNDPGSSGDHEETGHDHGSNDPGHHYATSFTIDMSNRLRDSEGTLLAGATFTVTKHGTTDKLYFVSDGDGSYGVAAQGVSGATDTVTVGTVTTGANPTVGKLVLKDVPEGTYDIEQKSDATDHHMVAGKPKFTLSVANARYDAGDTGIGGPNPVYDTSHDKQVKAKITDAGLWGLVTATAVDGVITPTGTDYNTAPLTVANVDSLAQLPLTGGAGVILIAALVVVCGAIAAGTSVLRRKNAMRSQK